MSIMKTGMTVMDLVRTRKGTMVHRKTCKTLAQAKKVYDWEWADGKSCQQIQACLDWGGYRCCMRCKPMNRGENR